jgi:hypothetical protein
MNMAAANKPTEDSIEEARFFLILVIGALLSAALPYLVSIPKHEGILVGWPIAFLVGYFIPPRPEMRFVRWMLERLILITSIYLSLFKLPLLLKPSLPTPLAYGIPITMFVVGFVLWLRHLRNSSLGRA